jgi:hypothetical protein
MLFALVMEFWSCGDALPGRPGPGLPLAPGSESGAWPVGELSSGDVPSIGWSTGLGGDMLMVGGGTETEMETGTIRAPVES